MKKLFKSILLFAFILLLFSFKLSTPAFAITGEVAIHNQTSSAVYFRLENLQTHDSNFLNGDTTCYTVQVEDVDLKVIRHPSFSNLPANNNCYSDKDNLVSFNANSAFWPQNISKYASIDISGLPDDNYQIKLFQKTCPPLQRCYLGSDSIKDASFTVGNISKHGSIIVSPQIGISPGSTVHVQIKDEPLRFSTDTNKPAITIDKDSTIYQSGSTPPTITYQVQKDATVCAVIDKPNFITPVSCMIQNNQISTTFDVNAAPLLLPNYKNGLVNRYNIAFKEKNNNSIGSYFTIQPADTCIGITLSVNPTSPLNDGENFTLNIHSAVGGHEYKIDTPANPLTLNGNTTIDCSNSGDCPAKDLSANFNGYNKSEFTIHVKDTQSNGECHLDIPLNNSDFSSGTSFSPIPSYPVCVGQPCAELKNGQCVAYNTGLGPLSTDPATFFLSISRWLFGIIGGIAMLLIIIAGYRIMASAGSPEKMQAGREILIAAITGLLFTIFSYVIYQTLTANILHLPGFDGNTPPSGKNTTIKTSTLTQEQLAKVCDWNAKDPAGTFDSTPTPEANPNNGTTSCNNSGGTCRTPSDCQAARQTGNTQLCNTSLGQLDCPNGQTCWQAGPTSCNAIGGTCSTYQPNSTDKGIFDCTGGESCWVPTVPTATPTTPPHNGGPVRIP